MRYGVVSDIHGNLPAFEAVCQAMPPVDAYLCAGDVVGYNPWPSECIERLRELEAVTVRGNHDHAVATDGGDWFNQMGRAGVKYSRRELDRIELRWLDSLATHETVADEDVLLVHGHPDDPDRYTYPDSFSASMLGERHRVVITGHTHVQGHREFDQGIVINPGSVGQPRDGDPRAGFAVVELDPDTRKPTVEEHRVEYDIDRVVDAVIDAGLPTRIGTRLRRGK